MKRPRVWLLLLGLLAISLMPSAHRTTQAASSPEKARGEGKPDPARGRIIFNGKGFCLNCHGRDGRISQRPNLAPEIVEMIAQLDPKPPDFRNPATLKLKTDQERMMTIKEGHPGTAMFPKIHLTDEEIANVLAYLSALRRQAASGNKPKK